MTPQQINLVKSSWRMIRDIKPALIGDLFYSKLFLDHPELRQMFPDNMLEQQQKLILMLQVIVARLDQFDQLAASLEDLAQRHVQYGVLPQHYAYVGDALLWTLERGLGADWTPDVANAWKTCYDVIAETMMNAAETPGNHT